MATAEKNYLVSSLGDVLALGRTTLNEQLKLTGSEISINEFVCSCTQAKRRSLYHPERKRQVVYRWRRV